MKEKGIKMEFAADAEDAAQQSISFGQAAASKCSTAADRHSFFRARRIQAATMTMW
jgi:hypothetical protein